MTNQIMWVRIDRYLEPDDDHFLEALTGKQRDDALATVGTIRPVTENLDAYDSEAPYEDLYIGCYWQTNEVTLIPDDEVPDEALARLAAFRLCGEISHD